MAPDQGNPAENQDREKPEKPDREKPKNQNQENPKSAVGPRADVLECLFDIR